MEETTAKTKFQALYIDSECKKKIQYWADAASGEVSGLGIVEKENEIMIVKEVFILEQECTGADTEIDSEAISKLMTELINDNKDPAKLKFWWHSHVNMGVFWSGTDDECAETLSQEFAFSTVVNKKGESKTRLDLYDPFRITVDNIRLLEITTDDEDLKKQCKQDIENKVKNKSFNNWKVINSNEGYYNRNNKRNHKNRKNFYDPYDSYEPNSAISKVKLEKETVDNILFLAESIFDNGFKQCVIDSFAYNLTKKAIKIEYKEKAECENGAGTYIEEEKLCKKCKIAKDCDLLTQKLDDLKNKSTDEVISKDDIEIIVDANC